MSPRKDGAIAWMVVIVGGILCLLVLGKIGVSILVLGLLYAIVRTVFGEGRENVS